MQTDLGFFETNCRLRGERIIGSIGCLNEGNPFPGSLILTSLRLQFLRSSQIGQQSRAIRLKSIREVSHHVEKSYHCILVVGLPSAEQRFELHGPDFSVKTAFVELLQTQLAQISDAANDQASGPAGYPVPRQTSHA